MEKQIQFENDVNEKLAGTLHLPRRHNGRGVVLAHCFTCSRHTTILRNLGQILSESGYLALRFDFSGNGQSEGRFEDTTFAKQNGEIQKAIKVLVREGATWIGLAGHSQGAEVAVIAASETPHVRGVCAIAGRLSGLRPSHFLTQNQKTRLMESGTVTFTSRGRNLRLKADFFSDAKRYDLPLLIRSFNRPMMIIHGEKDEIVPVSEAYEARAMNPKAVELLALPDADHMFTRPDDRNLAAKAIADWFDRLE